MTFSNSSRMAFSCLCIPAVSRSEFLSPICKVSPPPSRRRKSTATHRPAIQAELPSKPSKAPAALSDTAKSEQLIRRFWNLTASGKYSEAVSCFTDDAVYHDGLFPRPFVGKKEILAHFASFETSLPQNLVFVLDGLTASEERAGARWHVETESGTPLPASRGLSIYDLVHQDGEVFIAQAWEFNETPLKLPFVMLPLLRFAAFLLRLSQNTREKQQK